MSRRKSVEKGLLELERALLAADHRAGAYHWFLIVVVLRLIGGEIPVDVLFRHSRPLTRSRERTEKESGDEIRAPDELEAGTFFYFASPRGFELGRLAGFGRGT